MLENTIILVVDKSVALMEFEVSQILSEYGITETSRHADFATVGTGGLFGVSGIPAITVSDEESLKNLVSAMETSVKTGSLKNRLSNGLIIGVGGVDGRKLRKIKNLVKKAPEHRIVELVAPKNTSVAKVLVDKYTNLSKQTASFLVDYAGDDYETIIPVIRSLQKTPAKIQAKQTPLDMYIRLPRSEGSVPPWDIEPFVFKGDVSGAISTFRRIESNTGVMLVVVILAKKIEKLLKLKGLTTASKRYSDAEILKSLEVSKGQLYFLRKTAQKLSLTQLLEMSQIWAELEAGIKTGRVTRQVDGTELALIKLCQIARK